MEPAFCISCIIYLIDQYDYVARTAVALEHNSNIDKKAKQMLEFLIISGKEESKIPSGFKAIIPSDTKILSVEYVEGTIKVNFSKNILEIDEKDDIEDKRNWIKANPIRCSYQDGVKKIADEFKLAKEIPEKMVSFLTKCMNKWVQAKENGYMDMAKWKACEVNKIPHDLKGKDVFVGFDMSAKIDLTSVAFIIPILVDGVKKYVCFSHSFIPNEEKLRERTLKDKVPYNAWRLNGWLTVTNTEIVDQNKVMEYVINTCKENNWNIYQLCFDPANASKLMLDLQNEGNYEVVEVYQSHRSLNEATTGFREEVYQANVIYEHNPLLNFAMSNAVVKSNNGLIKIDKDISTKRIDPVDALLCAFKLAYYYDVNTNNNDIDEWLDNDTW